MRIFILGATGFIGRALVLRLLRDGHTLTAWVRDPASARHQLGADVSLVDARGGDAALAQAVDGVDAVVNLAGEPVLPKRWTKKRWAALRDSRVGLTERLVLAIHEAARRPAVLVSSSAIGIYGNRGDERLDEQSVSGSGRLARLCVDWEQAATGASALGVRTVRLCTGVVLGEHGGMLRALLPLFRLGVGGRLGSGRQFVSWIHLRDMIEIVARAIEDPGMEGAWNAVSPQPVRMSFFTARLARALRRPAFLPVPSFALRLFLGEASTAILSSQRVFPRRLEESGFRFQYSTLDGALAEIFERFASPVSLDGRPGRDTPPPIMSGSYLAERRPRHLLRDKVKVDAPVDEVFAFFSRPENLGLITPSGMAFRFAELPATMERGALIDYDLRVAGVPVRWRTRIEVWEEGRCFVDAQLRGPYRSWWHEHHFTPDGDGTMVEDRVYYALPFGWLGRAVHWLFVAGTLRAIFAHRAKAMRLRFRSGEPAPALPSEAEGAAGAARHVRLA